ncbi:MAG TPA: hypothetical protein VII06_42750 [Chloroflexota bacterium]|jgi:photosystem II stability/assembly factor-like uncharacterized protein
MAVATDRLSLYLLTGEGLVRGHTTDGLERVVLDGTDLDGETLREVCQDPCEPRRLWAASTTDLYRSDDGGASWDQLPAGGIEFRELWALAVPPTRPNELYIGTMPAAVYVSVDGGLSFRELASFRALPDYARWTFPPAPHTAHVRSIALDARRPDEVLVGVEEGGVALSRDGGANWEDRSGPASATAFPPVKDLTGQTRYEGGDYEPGRVYRDVHQVMRHPARPDTYFATTGRGTYRSDDAGRTWAHLTDGLPVAYSLHVAAHAAAPDRLFVGAAGNGPPGWKGWRPARGGPYASSRYRLDLSEKLGGAKAALFRSDDGGDHWRAVGGGLPIEHPYVICSLQVHPRDAVTLFVSYADGSVYVSRDAGEAWRCIHSGHPKAFGARVFAME